MLSVGLVWIQYSLCYLLVILLGDWVGALIYAISTNRRFSLGLNDWMHVSYLYYLRNTGLRMRRDLYCRCKEDGDVCWDKGLDKIL